MMVARPTDDAIKDESPRGRDGPIALDSGSSDESDGGDGSSNGGDGDSDGSDREVGSRNSGNGSVEAGAKAVVDRKRDDAEVDVFDLAADASAGKK